jgi:hypothetical protein
MATDRTSPDPRITELVAAVEAVPLTRYEGVTFKDQSVWLDGGEYVRCVFVGCEITVELGRFRFDGDQTFTNCEWVGGMPVDRWRALMDLVRGLPMPGPRKRRSDA